MNTDDFNKACRFSDVPVKYKKFNIVSTALEVNIAEKIE